MSYFAAHCRVVTAFVIREIATRYKSPGGYLWAFIEPACYIAMMSVIFGTLARTPALGENFSFFFATGYIGYSFYAGMVGYLSSAIRANKSLLQYPVVGPIDPVIGRLVLQSITSVFVAVVILFLTRMSEKHPHDIQWGFLFMSVCLAWTLALGVAMANIVLYEKYPLYEKLFDIAMKPLFLLSGVFYLPGEMPHPIREILLYNPIAHIVMIFRTGFFGPRASNGLDLAYVCEWATIGLMLGLMIFSLFPVGRTR